MNARDYAGRLTAAAAADPPATPPPVVRIVEALLFAGGQPVTAQLASHILRGLTAGQFREAVDELTRLYRGQNRPYRVEPRADGYVLILQPPLAGLRSRLTPGPREARLNVPALDVLAVVAYRQPVARAEIDSLRGSDSAMLLRQLVRLGLVTVEAGGVYSTTRRFLDLFGLKSLDDLPRTLDLQSI
jgi:segregation and condensation protein B